MAKLRPLRAADTLGARWKKLERDRAACRKKILKLLRTRKLAVGRKFMLALNDVTRNVVKSEKLALKFFSACPASIRSMFMLVETVFVPLPEGRRRRFLQMLDPGTRRAYLAAVKEVHDERLNVTQLKRKRAA